MKLRIEGYPGIIHENEIAKIFNKYGSVEKVEKAHNRNATTVTMTEDYQPEKALKELDGSMVFGRIVKVSKETQY